MTALVPIYSSIQRQNTSTDVLASGPFLEMTHFHVLHKIQSIKIKKVNNVRISSYLQFHPEAKYFDGCSGIWSIPCDVALPCATQNEIDQDSANQLLDNGVKIVAEGANMPSTAEAIRVFQSNNVLFGP